MDNEVDSAESLAERWRVRCAQHGDELRFNNASVAADRLQVEQAEELWIEEICRADLPIAIRAVAFRSVMELRGCTARQLATFFAVEPGVIIHGMSLLEVPQQYRIEAESRASLPRRSHRQAA
jgi:hypothetical protein